MNNIEKYFNNKPTITTDFYNKNEEYDIENKNLFKLLVNINLWANELSFTDEKYIRIKQKKFRDEIINRDKICIITKKYEETECEACHIVSVNDGGTYDINNGIFINLNHHKTFDKNLWCINPDNYTIDILIDDRKVVGSIIEYKDKLVDYEFNNIMKHYLRKRWNTYVEYKNNYNKNQCMSNKEG
jgi:hypothetical protein